MPSVANCNVPNKSRRKANRNKIQKRKAAAGISKNPRGTATSSVIFPTHGPLAPLSSKKARKVEKARNHARQRALEKALAEQGEIAMTGMISTQRAAGIAMLICHADAPQTTKSKSTAAAGGSTEKMEVDDVL